MITDEMVAKWRYLVAKRVKQENEIDITQEAMRDYINYISIDDAISHFMRDLRGRITRLIWIKNNRGVGETLVLKFPDSSALRIIKFISTDKQTRISLKRED